MSKYLVASLSLLVAIAGILAQTNGVSVGRDATATAVPAQSAPRAVRDTTPAKSVRPHATGAVATPTSEGTNAELPNADHQPIGFTGYYKDTESGLYYANARYYDPRIARFTTPDPLEGTAMNPPSLHRYLYAYANPTVYTDPTGRCADALCSWGLGMAYAHDDDDRASVTRAALNTDPTLGRTAGAMYEAGMQFASPAQLASDAADALQGDLEAQRRWEQRADTVQAFGNRMQDARDRYGDAGPAVQIVSDFALRAGEHAAQFEVAGNRMDYFGQGQSGLQIAGDVATVGTAYGAMQRFLGTSRAMGAGAQVPPFSDTDSLRLARRMEINPDSDFGPINQPSMLAETGTPNLARNVRTGRFASDPFAASSNVQLPPTGNRNLRSTQDPTIFYRIDVDGQGRKVGISSVPPGSDGEYTRPASQVRALEELYGDTTTVKYRVRREFPDRASALDYERAYLDLFRDLYGQYPGEGLPGGNKTNR